MSSKRELIRYIAFAVLLSLGSVAYAQVNQGQIAGTVTDPSGAGIPKAALSAKNVATGSTYTSISGPDGGFRFAALAIGTYNVSARASGFGSVESTGVVVQIGTTTTLPLHLKVGDTTQSVTVNGSAQTVETDSSDIGGVITQKQIAQLPLALGGLGQFRAIESFAFLVPGTVGPGTATVNQGSNAAEGAGIYLSKIGGGQNFGAQVYLDGISTYREENGSTFDEIAPSVEAISEFKVTTSTPEAEYGRTSGGIENFGTKSGTNEIHGTVFDIFRNTALDANSWFNNGYLSLCASVDPNPVTCAQNYKRSVDQKNDYGVDLGGPVRIPHLFNGRDKLFFFFAFEQFAKKQSTTQQSTVPTVLERMGNFTELLAANGTPTGQTDPCTGQQNLNGEIFDPSTSTTVNGQPCRSPFMYGGQLNVINPAQITQLGKNIIAAYPLPQTAGLTNNYTYRSTQTLNNTTDTIRVDANATSKLKLFASYSARENTVPFGGSAPSYPGPAGANILQDFSTHLTRVGVNYVISPNLLNSLTFGVNRLKNFDLSSEIANGVNYGAQLGIAGIQSTAFPNIIPQDGVSALGAATNSDHTELHFLINDALSWQKGRNSFQFGFNYRYTQFVATTAGNSNGQFYGYNAETAASNYYQGQANGTGFGLAGLELGLPDYIRYITPSDPKWITNYWAGYVQDNVKASRSLTLNLGLRYEVDTPRHEARNQTSNFSPTAIDPKNGLPGALIFGNNCRCNTAWANTYFKDIGPRVGFAYAPPVLNGKTVLRGGASILYAPILYADFGTSMLQGYIFSLGVGGDGFNAAGNLNNGIPSFPAPPNLDPGQNDTGNAAAPEEVEDIEPSFGRNGMVSEWSLQVQQELAKSTIFSLGYIGQAGQNLPSFLLQPNNFATKNLALGDELSSFNLSSAGIAAPYPGFNGTVGQALRPFPQYSNLDTPTDIENVGHTSFNALVVALTHRSGYGLTFDASYTWSKTITDADSAIGGINGGTPGLIQDSSNLKSAKSVSIQDIPNNFVANYLYELPFGRNKLVGGHAGRLVDSLIGGWTVGGIHRYLSGVPFSFGCSNTNLGGIGYNDCISLTHIPGTKIASGLTKKTVKPFAFLQPLKYGPAPAGPNPQTDSIFNGANFFGTNDAYQATEPNPAFYDQNLDIPAVRNGGPFKFGNLPRVSGAVRNFRYLQEDFVLIKNTPIFRDLYQFQFKVECLDCFNRHNFNAPDGNALAGDFGVPTSVVGGQTDSMRRLQLTGRFTF